MVVASAGNDRSCRPSYPAAFAEVVAVGATGPYGAAWFTNFGPWVNACAPGVDIIGELPDPFRPTASTDTADQTATDTSATLAKSELEPARRGTQVISWSGTSFSAPAVAASIARRSQQLMAEVKSLSKRDALAYAKYELVDEPSLLRLPGLGTVVNTTPSYDPPLPPEHKSAT